MSGVVVDTDGAASPKGSFEDQFFVDHDMYILQIGLKSLSYFSFILGNFSIIPIKYWGI